MRVWSGPLKTNKKAGGNIKSKLYPKIFFSLIVIAILVLSYNLTKPFLPTLLSGAIIAYLVYPLYNKTLQYIKNKNLASLIISVFIVLLVTVPFVSVLGLVSKEAYDTYTSLNKQDLGTNFLRIVCKEENWLSCKTVKSLIGFLPEDDLDYYIQTSIQKITIFIIENFSNFLTVIPTFLFNLLIMAFIIYYLLLDGEAITKRIKNILPLKEVHKQHVLQRFHNTTHAVFYGNISVALIQGIAGAIGFLILGIPSPILWGVVMALFALIPYFGTAIIWLPAALNLIFIGYLQNDNSSTVRGIVLIIYGVLVISSIDNFLKPKIIGAKAKVHPILVLLGVLGGLNLFGLVGLILGPIMLALLMTLVEIYEEEKAELEKYF